MEVLKLGHNLLAIGGILSLVILVLAGLGGLRASQRWIRGARVGFYALLVVVGGSAGCLVYGFISGVYNTESIYNHSEKYLPAFFKLAGIWAGLDGSLLFWTFLLSGFAAAAALQLGRSAADPASPARRLEPHTYVILSALCLFFIVVTWNENPFKMLPLETRLRLASMHDVAIDSSGNLLDGGGLNQQLVNYWFVIHPPTLYMGFVGWAVPFALAVAGLFANDLGSYWIRIVRRWSMVAWVFLTSGIILGGLWAYRQLGWGGYWAWDPVENASLLPWLTGTAFLHSLLVTERRGVFRRWTVFLLLLTFYLTIVGTWMTRSGVVSSIHAFAGGPIGTWFLVFLFALAGFSAFVLAFRFRSLGSGKAIDSLLSKEAAFFLNNFVLVAITVVVFVLSFWPKISHDWLASMMTDQDGGAYNRILTPLFTLLLFLTAVGPGLTWGRTTGATMARHFRGPLVATAVFLLLLYAFFFWKGIAGTPAEILRPRLAGAHPTALYPTGILLALSFLACAVVLGEMFRAARARVRGRGELFPAAMAHVLVGNNRRYGGYIVHLGLAVLASGIIVSSMFKEKAELILKLGESARVGSYVVSPISEEINETPLPGEPYAKVQVLFRVNRAAPGALPVAHGDTGAPDTSGPTGSSVAPAEGRNRIATAGAVVTELRPERRFYPKKRQWINEVTIHRTLFEDIYIYFTGRDQEGRISFEVFINPFMMFLYTGWLTMVAGAVFAALPLRPRRSRWRAR